MPRPTKAELYDQARAYLDTDELNFPDSLLEILAKRVWFQAINMEREWRFFQQFGTAPGVAGELIPMTFSVGVNAQQVPAIRIYSLAWNDGMLPWVEYTTGLDMYPGSGEPVAWSELNTGNQRNVRLFPHATGDGLLSCDFYADSVFPANDVDGFGDVPEEFDSALLEGLLADMYYREEDPDLGDLHAGLFQNQMGSIRDRWRGSIDIPIVVAGRARRPGYDPGGIDAMGRVTQPVARRRY